MLDDISKFKLSNTCLDVFLMNYLCPLCRNQPLMCPGRCTEIITGCVSPLNQVLVQADVSLKLTLSIAKKLDTNRKQLPSVLNNLMESIKKFKYIKASLFEKILKSCGLNLFNPLSFLPIPLPSLPPITLPPITLPKITLPPITFPPITFPPVTLPPATLPPVRIRTPRIRFGKRHISIQTRKYKRSLNFPLSNPTIIMKLETISAKIASYSGGRKMASELCDPNFNRTVPLTEVIPATLLTLIPSITFKLTATNGMCSYGVGNTGSYTSTFAKYDITDQVYNNPAGRFDCEQLLDQAKQQTYVITELFSDTSCVPKSIFSVFLPYETFPTTDFLRAQKPADPNSISG